MTFNSSVPLVLIFLIVVQFVGVIWWLSKFRTQFDERTMEQKERGEKLDRERHERDKDIKEALIAIVKKMDRFAAAHNDCRENLPKDYVSQKEGSDLWAHINDNKRAIVIQGERIAKIEARPCP